MPASSSLNNAIPGPDDLLSGNLRTMPVSIAAGTYVRGQVLWLDDNVYAAFDVEATTAVAAAIMPFDKTLASETVLAVYVEGDFNEDALVIGDATLADVKAQLRQAGIMARKWGAAPNVA